jgi:outer membrane receptor protein involved in Fe transport
VKKFDLKSALLRTTLLATVVSASAATTAVAQEAGPAASEERDTIVITGSRIARQDYIANSPIVTVDAEDIQATGVTTLDTLMNSMPQFVPGVNMTSNNPSNGGQANLQLRGLGSARTLVLMNGRRVIPSNASGAVDVNIIPSQLVQNIEVITGGASATYGSDAIAGVVNFILRDIEGFEVSAQYGQTLEFDDAGTRSVSLATGGKFADGKGKASVMMSYNIRDDLYNASRAFAKISGPSGASPLGNLVFDANNLPTAAAITAAVPGAIPSNTFGFNNNNTLFAHQGRRDFVSPGGIDYDGFAAPGATFSSDFLYNTGALNLMVLPQSRYNAFGKIDYDINDATTVYSEFLFTNYESAQELAASPAASTTGFRVPVSNPYIPAELRTVLASRDNPLGSFRFDKRFSALGPRRGAEIYDVFQVTTGVRGDVGLADWTYDAYMSLGRVDRTTIQTGNVSRSAVQNLLNATDGGASICAGGFDWFGETTLSDACKTYIGRTAKNLQIQEQRNVEISSQGTLFALPAGDVKAALGASYREDSFDFIPDGSLVGPLTVQPCVATAAYAGTNLAQSVCSTPASAATATTGNPTLTGNDIAGFNPSGALAGNVDVVEYFGEFLVPLLKDLPAVKELNLTLAGRVSDYSTINTVNTYKADLDWTVIDGLRLRGGYQQAIRAPSVGELFAPQLLGFPSTGTPRTTAGVPQKSGDPCDVRSAYRSVTSTGTSGDLAASTNANVTALCLAQGLPASIASTYTYANQQMPGLSGGNPDLSEESAETWSIGAVWSPNFGIALLEDLTLSVDYYNIFLDDSIGGISAGVALQQCYNADGKSNPTYDPNNFFCSLITRSTLSGNVTNITSTNQNLGGSNRSGVDFQIDWGYGIGPGDLDVSFVGSWLELANGQPLPGGSFIDSTGTISSGVATAFPEWKWMASANYSIGPARIGARWQYIGEMDNFNNRAVSIPAVHYVDVIGSYQLSDNISFRATVNNVFDEPPPVYTPSVQANTDPSTYDVLGRRFTLGVTMKY